MTESGWLALRPKRTAIEAAFSALGMPHTGWMNEVPTFKAGYKPDWAEIEKVALNVESVVIKPKPKPKAVVKKPPAKLTKTK